MDMNSIAKMIMGNSAKSNPAFEQLMLVSQMLGKLSKEEQTRIITGFITELKEAVDEVEGRGANAKKEG